MGCIAARVHRGPFGWLRGFAIAQVYTPYSWFLWPVLLRATVRQLTARGEWAKTEREPLLEPLDGVTAISADHVQPTGKDELRAQIQS
jgi:hypothetical protein